MKQDIEQDFTGKKCSEDLMRTMFVVTSKRIELSLHGDVKFAQTISQPQVHIKASCVKQNNKSNTVGIRIHKNEHCTCQRSSCNNGILSSE